jgi:hypothetical protein
MFSSFCSSLFAVSIEDDEAGWGLLIQNKWGFCREFAQISANQNQA